MENLLAKSCMHTRYAYPRLLVDVQRADLYQLAANILNKQLKNMVLFVGVGWGLNAYIDADQGVDAVMIPFLDIENQCGKINSNKYVIKKDL